MNNIDDVASQMTFMCQNIEIDFELYFSHLPN